MWREALAPIGFAFGLYVRHATVWCWSLPIALMRVAQVTQEPALAGWPGIVAELAVESLRVGQALVAVAIAKGVPIRRLRDKATWRPAPGPPLTAGSVAAGLAGYLLLVAALNVLISDLAGRQVVTEAAQGWLGAGEPAQGRAAVVLALKNLVLIPVSLLTMLRLFRLVP